MSLASFEDANNHLDQNKVRFPNETEAGDIAESVDRYVRGRLNSIYGDQILMWDESPTLPQVATPEMIKEIASMLMAAKLYAEKYSLEDDVNTSYATRLKRDAEALIDSLIDGSMTLVEVEIVSGSAFSQDDFWPNDTTGADTYYREPKFTMDDVF